MKLNEVATSCPEIDLLRSAWIQMHPEGSGFGNFVMVKGADLEDCYAMAATLHRFAVRQINFEDELSSLRNLVTTRSIPGTRSCLRNLRKTGFCDVSPVHMLDLSTESDDLAEFRMYRKPVIPFTQNVTRLVSVMRRLNDIAMGHEQITLPHIDSFDRSVAKATMKKLDLPLGIILV
jgi:hypothetical protein